MGNQNLNHNVVSVEESNVEAQGYFCYIGVAIFSSHS
jgi:hypothetical protein